MKRLVALIRASTWTMSDTQRFLVLSIFIGLFAGLIVVCFHVAIERLSWVALGSPPGSWPGGTLLSPFLGAGIAALLVGFVFKAAQGSGVNHTKSAIYVSDGFIPSTTIVGKFLACSLSIGSGMPLGPEDPALQMGAGTASLLGRALRLPRAQLRLIAPIGAAAGIGAAFNTPIAAVLFVIEEILQGWNAGVLGSIVLAAVSAVVVSRSFLGDEPLFRVPEFTLTHPSELLVYAAVGLAGGLFGALHVKALGALRHRLMRDPVPLRLAQPFVAGLVVGLVGLIVPEVLGAGYLTIDGALHDEFGWQRLFEFGLLKAALVAFAFSSGTPGGLFAPTLFVGAMLGGGMGGLAHEYWPVATSDAGAYVLVGMGTFFAAVFRTPMTSIFMVFEVSATYAIIPPVMIANTVAYLVSRSLQPQGLFDQVARQDGTPLPSPEEDRQQPRLHVEDVMRSSDGLVVLDPMTRVGEATERVEPGPWPVALVGQSPRGWVPIARDELLAARSADGLATVGSLVRDRPVRGVHPDEAIDPALRILASQPAVPVVSRSRPSRLLGILTVEDVLRAFGGNATVLKSGIEGTGTGLEGSVHQGGQPGNSQPDDDRPDDAAVDAAR
jgi:CIC family chloride channel protein